LLLDGVATFEDVALFVGDGPIGRPKTRDAFGVAGVEVLDERVGCRSDGGFAFLRRRRLCLIVFQVGRLG